jgi:exodeoxyribonuclease V gamma subunit
MVLVPDVERYAPYAQAVFGPLHKQLPFHLADRHPASELPVCRAALHVLALARTRLTVAEVLQLLELSAVQRRFKIFAGEVGLLRHLCQSAGVRWGLDGEQRSARFELPRFEDNSWRQGLDRLLLGNLTGPVDDLVCGIAPVGDTTEGRAELLTRFSRFLEVLFELLPALRAPQPLRARADQLDALVAALFEAEDAAEEDAVRQLRRAAVALRTQAVAAAHTEVVELAVFASWLDGALAQGSAARGGADRGFLGGAVTFAGMLPMRAVPVRALFVCGLDDASFPRRDAPPPFDLISSDPRPGDRSRRLDDRQLFLDLLLAARDKLHLTYVGRSAKDNADCAPSIVISELLEHVDRTCCEGAAAQVLVRHPLQPWSPRYREGAPGLFTYAAQPAIGGDHATEPPWCPPSTPLLPDARAPHVRLDELLAFWSAPCRAFLERGLRLRVRKADEPDDDCEPFELSGLTRYALQDDAVRRAQRGEPEREDPLAWARARGVLPVGAQGDVAYDAALAAAGPMLHEARRFAASAVRRVDVEVDGVQVTGELDGLSEDARTAMRASSLKPKDRLRGWIEHLVLSLQGARDSDSEAPWPARTRLLAAGTEHVYRPIESEAAAEHLSQLLELYFEGLTRPLAFFEQSSFGIGAGLAKGTSPAALLPAARAAFEGRNDKRSYDADLDDPAIALCMRGRDPVGEGDSGELVTLAEIVWGPALAHLEEVEQ